MNTKGFIRFAASSIATVGILGGGALGVRRRRQREHRHA